MANRSVWSYGLVKILTDNGAQPTADSERLETLGSEKLDDPTLNAAAEWDDTDANVTHNELAGTATWDGLGTGSFKSVDSPFTIGILYKIVIVIDSISTGRCFVNRTGGSFRYLNNPTWETPGIKTIYLVCTNDSIFSLDSNVTCNAVVSNISVKEVLVTGSEIVAADWSYGLLVELFGFAAAIYKFTAENVDTHFIAENVDTHFIAEPS